jgi:hypothetical protein
MNTREIHKSFVTDEQSLGRGHEHRANPEEVKRFLQQKGLEFSAASVDVMTWSFRGLVKLNFKPRRAHCP